MNKILFFLKIDYKQNMYFANVFLVIGIFIPVVFSYLINNLGYFKGMNLSVLFYVLTISMASRMLSNFARADRATIKYLRRFPKGNYISFVISKIITTITGVVMAFLCFSLIFYFFIKDNPHGLYGIFETQNIFLIVFISIYTVFRVMQLLVIRNKGVLSFTFFSLIFEYFIFYLLYSFIEYIKFIQLQAVFYLIILIFLYFRARKALKVLNTYEIS